MTRTPQELARYYESISDAELKRLHGSGGLLPEAQALIEAEFRNRQLAIPQKVAPPPAPEMPAEYLGDWVTVAGNIPATEANFLKTCLEAANIPAQVANQHASNLLGEIALDSRLRVPEACREEAESILRQFKSGALRVEDSALEQASLAASTAEKIHEEIVDRRSSRLRTYYVYEKPGERVPIVVKKGFSWGAAFLGVFWLLLNRMWLTVVAWLLMHAALRLLTIEFIERGLMKGPFFATWMSLAFLLMIAFGFVANYLLVLSLESKGYKRLAMVQARGVEHARDVAQQSSA